MKPEHLSCFASVGDNPGTGGGAGGEILNAIVGGCTESCLPLYALLGI